MNNGEKNKKMKFKVTYELVYNDRTSVKIVNILNCNNKEHCKEKFHKWVDEKSKNAKEIIIKSIEEIKEVSYNSAKNITNMYNGLFGNIFGNPN